MFEKTKSRYAHLSNKVPPKTKAFLKKIPFGLLSAVFLGITYFIAGTIGMLIVPAVLAVFFILPFSMIFAVLDIVIRKKKLVPIICLCLSCYTYFGMLSSLIAMLFGIIKQIILK